MQFMAQYSTGDVRSGYKVEVEGEPYTVVANEFIKPGKGQPFNRIKLKHLITGRVVEKTFKSGEKDDEADGVVFMDDKTFEQLTLSNSLIDNKIQWLMEETLYDVVFYKGQPIDV